MQQKSPKDFCRSLSQPQTGPAIYAYKVSSCVMANTIQRKYLLNRTASSGMDRSPPRSRETRATGSRKKSLRCFRPKGWRHTHLAHHPVDVHVGARLRQRRLLLGKSSSRPRNAAAIAYQQVQKYKSGRDRTSSSRLFEFAKILNVPVPYFFEEMAPGLAKGLAEGGPTEKKRWR